MLEWLPGWILDDCGLALVRDYGFRGWAGTVLFVAFFSAVVRLNDFDLDFLIDVAGSQAAVGLGAWSFNGITPRAALLARVADELHRLNLAED